LVLRILLNQFFSQSVILIEEIECLPWLLAQKILKHHWKPYIFVKTWRKNFFFNFWLLNWLFYCVWLMQILRFITTNHFWNRHSQKSNLVLLSFDLLFPKAWFRKNFLRFEIVSINLLEPTINEIEEFSSEFLRIMMIHLCTKLSVKLGRQN